MKANSVNTTLAMAAAVVMFSALVGCNDYIPFSEEEINYKLYNKQYDDVFVQLFGQPAENHDWGMTLLEPINLGGGVTRAVSNNVNVNRNQWCERNNSGYSDNALAKNINVPGWPNFDGYYYGNNGSSTFGGKYTHDYIFNQDAGRQIQPCGDVTEYEINYVSTWFRTHKNPVSEPLHLTDFFVQNISQDNDQLNYFGAQIWTPENHNSLPGGYPKAQSGKSQWWNGDNANYANDVLKSGSLTEKKDGVRADVFTWQL